MSIRNGIKATPVIYYTDEIFDNGETLTDLLKQLKEIILERKMSKMKELKQIDSDDEEDDNEKYTPISDELDKVDIVELPPIMNKTDNEIPKSKLLNSPNIIEKLETFSKDCFTNLLKYISPRDYSRTKMVSKQLNNVSDLFFLNHHQHPKSSLKRIIGFELEKDLSSHETIPRDISKYDYPPYFHNNVKDLYKYNVCISCCTPYINTKNDTLISTTVGAMCEECFKSISSYFRIERCSICYLNYLFTNHRSASFPTNKTNVGANAEIKSESKDEKREIVELKDEIKMCTATIEFFNSFFVFPDTLIHHNYIPPTYWKRKLERISFFQYDPDFNRHQTKSDNGIDSNFVEYNQIIRGINENHLINQIKENIDKITTSLPSPLVITTSLPSPLVITTSLPSPLVITDLNKKPEDYIKKYGDYNVCFSCNINLRISG